jgi:aryl-alcohol dehydrogenase-like predicted oxidoreductase
VEKILLGDSNLQVSKFIFGTAKIHNILSGKERRRILGATVDCGFTHFDTSPLYGYGIAEKELGLIAKSHPNITITTKYGLYGPGRMQKPEWETYARKVGGKFFPLLSSVQTNFDVKHAYQSLQSSLRRIRRDYVDLFMLHEPLEELNNLSETLDFLTTLKSRGLIRNFGVSGRWKSIEQIYLEAPNILEVVQIQDEAGIPLKDLEKFTGGSRLVTYGYGDLLTPSGLSYLDRIRYGLARNKGGAIIVSTNNLDRVEQYGKLLLESK